MPVTPNNTYSSGNRLNAFFDSINEARQMPINLGESLTLAKGTVMALAAARNEVQSITGSTNITGGTWTIGFNGRTTSALNYNDNAATVQAALAALLNIGSGNVSVSGGHLGTNTAFSVTFQGALANLNVPTLTVNTANLTGTNTAVTVATTTPGRSTACYVPYSSAVVAAPTVAPTPTAANGNGFPAGTYTVGYTYVNAQGETTLGPTATVTTASSNLAISLASLTPLPTGVTAVNWYVSDLAGSLNLIFAVQNNGGAITLSTANTNVPVAGAKTPPQTNTAYAATNGAGAQTAKGFLVYACTSDADGLIKLLEVGPSQNTVPMYISGTFITTDLVGLDAKAITDMGGELVSGTLSNGIVRIG